jgi:hypothetical protein
MEVRSHSDLRRICPKPAVKAMLYVMGVVVLCLGLLLVVIINAGPVGGRFTLGAAGRGLVPSEMGSGIVAVTIALGLINWQFLRWIGRESDIAYAIAGLTGGFACAALVVYLAAGEIGAKHLHDFVRPPLSSTRAGR